MFRISFSNIGALNMGYIFLFCTAFLSRYAVLGHPFIYSDEEFYLFTGGQMLHGALPFVDIWDRKPIGLFLLYAVFHLFGEWRLYAYQIAALISAWWTACLIFNMARTVAPIWGSLAAGSLYLLWIIGVHGEGGQSSIFYEALVCLSIWCVVREFPYLIKGEKLRQTGLVVMALFGLSMQIKYTTLFEGIYVGLVLLFLGWQAGRPYKKLFIDSLLWVGMALLPTLCAFTVYVLKGHGQAWWFANMQSMLLRHAEIDAHDVKGFLFISIVLLGGMGLSWFFRPRQSREAYLVYIFLLGWAVAAFCGYCILREFPKHYSIPLFPPFLVLVSLLCCGPVGQVWIVGMVILGGLRGYSAEKRDVRGPSMKEVKAVQVAVSAPSGCSFMFTGQSILLDMLPYCSLTAYPFPAHISFESEKDALGVNPAEELHRIMRQKPLYLLDSQIDDRSEENPQTRRIFDEYIRRDYKLIYKHGINDHESDIVVYKRIAP